MAPFTSYSKLQQFFICSAIEGRSYTQLYVLTAITLQCDDFIAKNNRSTGNFFKGNQGSNKNSSVGQESSYILSRSKF